MKLLFITQKIDQNDDDLAFTILWIKEFIKQGFDVAVICLQKGDFDNSFPVYSLGKEKGVRIFGRTIRFLKLIFTLKYDRVFVHMNPEYFTVGGWWWALRGIPSYLWYTHYTMTLHLWLAGIYANYLFAATAQSLPQFKGNPKKIILGHGIDVSFWDTPKVRVAPDPLSIISVHRLSRSKRLELAFAVLTLLPEYTLTVYGRPIDPVYFEELKRFSEELGIASQVRFMGPVPMPELKQVYPHHSLMINMASETIDKTMLEGMLYGVYPVTTPRNAAAIGLPVFPVSEDPKDIAEFVRSGAWKGPPVEALRSLVIEKHSLENLIKSMSVYLNKGA